MAEINPGVDLKIWGKKGEAQDAYITNPNMETADACIQALQKTTITLMDSVLMLAGSEFRKLMCEELERNPGGEAQLVNGVQA